ncbi:MAG: hypothetical protein RLN76_13460 [Phycisphaeraceae bacterium]
MAPRSCLTLLAALTLTAMLAACSEGPVYVYSDDGVLLPKQAGAGLVPRLQENWLIPDVPTPVGFQPVTSMCYASFDGNARTITHVYQGRTHLSDAVRFFRQNLRDPALGWTFEGMGSTDNGVHILDYTKGPEALQVRIRTENDLTTLNIEIVSRGLVSAY